MQQINSLLQIADKFDTFFIDVFGVLWSGEEFYQQALDVCKKLIARGNKIYILSNASTVGSHFKEKHIKEGFLQGIYFTDVVTSGNVMKHKLEADLFLNQVMGSDTGKFLRVGLPNDLLFQSVLNRQTDDVNAAKAVYIGALRGKKDGKTIYYDNIAPYLDVMQKALDKGLPAICSNPDYFAFHGLIKHVTSGSLGKWYEEHGGKVYWVGKPYPEIYQFALRVSGAKPENSVMVGDTLRTDIKGGYDAGMKTVLITGTGVTNDELRQGKTLRQCIQAEGVEPDYLLERLS